MGQCPKNKDQASVVIYQLLIYKSMYRLKSIRWGTHEYLVPNFYIINLPSIIGNDLILYIIVTLWKAGLLCKN